MGVIILSQKQVVTSTTASKVITVTKDTNQYMGMCVLKNQRQSETEATYEDLIHKIDQAVKNRYSEIVFQGGEPFVRTDMFEILKYAVDKKVKVSIISSLNMLSDSQTERLCNIGIHRVIVEFPSTHRCKYSKIMSVNQRMFDIALENVLHLIVRGIRVEIRAKVNDINKNEMPEIRNFFCSMGVEEKYIKFVFADKNENVINDKRLLYPDGQYARRSNMNSLVNFEQAIISNF